MSKKFKEIRENSAAMRGLGGSLNGAILFGIPLPITRKQNENEPSLFYEKGSRTARSIIWSRKDAQSQSF
jgi:hypothetical protein